MKKILIILLAFIGLAVGATVGVQAQESDIITTEKWRCFDRYDYLEATVLVELSRVTSEALGIGEVSVAGITYTAVFKVSGFDRRWDFGEGFEYSFIIKPSGDGAYYDFSNVEDGGKTSPSQFYSCMSP